MMSEYGTVVMILQKPTVWLGFFQRSPPVSARPIYGIRPCLDSLWASIGARDTIGKGRIAYSRAGSLILPRKSLRGTRGRWRGF